MAGYKKKRARELKHDRFRDTTLSLFDRLGDRLEGKGQAILYGLATVVALAVLVGIYSWWSARRTEAARRALGHAIEIAEAPVMPSPSPGSTALSFPTERDRAERAVKEFQAVADKHPDPYREIARFFVATNLLTVDRNRGLSELETLVKSGDAKISSMAKFALAQAREEDGQYDQAATAYQELLNQKNAFLPSDTINLRLAAVYEKQGKKKEAADILFAIVETSRKAKDQDGKPAMQTASAREAAQKLEKLDPARYAQLPAEPLPAGLQM